MKDLNKIIIDNAVKLMISSSDTNPYTGKLSHDNNVLAAIELAELVLDFSEKGMSDEAMDLSPDHMKGVVSKLKEKR